MTKEILSVRPPAVTLISVYYAFSAVVSVLALAALRYAPQGSPAAAFFRDLSPFICLLYFGNSLCNLAGAIALFRLSRSALYLFIGGLLCLIIAFDAWENERTSAMPSSHLIMSGLMMLIPLLVTWYTWKLYKRGTLT